jgi:hypothetical protein
LGDVDCTHSYEAHIVNGSISKHTIWFVSHLNKTLQHVHELYYFCKYCVNGGDGPCDNYIHVRPWDLVTLEPCSPIDVRCDLDIHDRWQVSHDGESLTACVEVGFVVVAINDTQDNASSWILICTERLHMVAHEKHVDAYGQMFLYGNQNVMNKYFKQQGRSPYSYVQHDKGETYIYSHLIRAMKF